MTKKLKQKSGGGKELKKGKSKLKKVGKISIGIKKSKAQPTKQIKRKPKNVVKNILQNPFALTLSYIDAACEEEIAKQLEICCKELKTPVCKPPWNKVQGFKKGEDRKKFYKEYRKEFLENLQTNDDSLKQYEMVKEALSHLIFGYNAVMRALEKNYVAAILVKKDAQPITIVETFLPGCVNKCIPLVPLLGLDKILKKEDTLAIPHSVMALGLKLSVKEESCRFYPLYEKMTNTIASMQRAHNAFLLENDIKAAKIIEDEQEKEKVTEGNEEDVDISESFISFSDNKENVQEAFEKRSDSDKAGPVDVNLYHLKRTKKDERVFVPPTTIERVNSNAISDPTLEFIAVKGDSEKTNVSGGSHIPLCFEFRKKKRNTFQRKPYPSFANGNSNKKSYEVEQEPLSDFRETRDIIKTKPDPTSSGDFKLNFFLDSEGDNMAQGEEESRTEKNSKRPIEENGDENQPKKKKKSKDGVKSGIKDKIKSKKDKKKNPYPTVNYPYIPAQTKRIKNNPNRKGSKNKQ